MEEEEEACKPCVLHKAKAKGSVPSALVSLFAMNSICTARGRKGEG